MNKPRRQQANNTGSSSSSSVSSNSGSGFQLSTLLYVLPLLVIAAQAAYYHGIVTTKLEDFGTRVLGIETRLNSLDEDIRSKVLAARAEIASIAPNLQANQASAVQVLEEARETFTPIDTAVIERVGNSFVNAAHEDPNAWKVALDYLSYRTVQNRLELQFNFEPTTAVDGRVQYNARPAVDGKPTPTLTAASIQVPADQAAVYEDIGEGLNADMPTGRPFLQMRNGAVRLDGKHIRQVIFQGVEIHYDGGPVRLEGVFFVNCTFVMGNSEPGRRLATGLLANSSVTFENPA